MATVDHIIGKKRKLSAGGKFFVRQFLKAGADVCAAETVDLFD